MAQPVAKQASLDDLRPESANYHANALARGLGVLERLAAARQPLTLSQLSDGTGLPKSTLVRLLSVLAEMDYVFRVDEAPSYRLGYKVEQLGGAYSRSLRLADVVDQYLRPLAESTGQTANLGVLQRHLVEHVAVCEPPRPLRFTAPVGHVDPAYCTALGKALLAELPEREWGRHLPQGEPWPAFTANTITGRARLDDELRVIKEQGYSVCSEESAEGLRCVAVVVADEPGDTVLAALSLSGPAGEFTDREIPGYVERLRQAAAQLMESGDFRHGLRFTALSRAGAAAPDRPAS